jgi:hypothetical protein
MSEKEFDSRGFPIEYIKEATAWYIKNKGCTEAEARLAAETQYEIDVSIFKDIDNFLKTQIERGIKDCRNCKHVAPLLVFVNDNCKSPEMGFESLCEKEDIHATGFKFKQLCCIKNKSGECQDYELKDA